MIIHNIHNISHIYIYIFILQVTDCINVADECICAITQLLPALYEFNLQVSAIVNIDMYHPYYKSNQSNQSNQIVNIDT